MLIIIIIIVLRMQGWMKLIVFLISGQNIWFCRATARCKDEEKESNREITKSIKAKLKL
jgi:hypothetical protein